MDRPSVYDYLDYRVYLMDMFTYRKKNAAHFSYRYFSGKAGFSSPNFLKLVVNGQRNLTNNSVAKVATGFGLKTRERDYFENLVFMNQADNHQEKNHYYNKMAAVAGVVGVSAINRDQYDYFSKWYYPAIRELIAFEPEISLEQIAIRLVPSISTREAQKALQLLERLDLIEKGPEGRWRQLHKEVSTGPEIKSMVVANFHKAVMTLAQEAIDRIEPGRRDISALTLSIPRNRLQELKERMVAFRKEMMALAGSYDAPDTVVQVNIQMFPLSR